MPDFLLELRSEEIPARMQTRACEDLARLFTEQLTAAGLAASIETYVTPRRLALIARGLPDVTDSQSEERRGPRADAPAQALEGFLKSTGLTRDQLEERTDKKGSFLYAVIARPGRSTIDVLAQAIPAIVRAFPWPKSMRWGAGSTTTESLRWVRPLQGIVALFGEHIVPCEVAGIVSGAATLGHRFHHPGIITIGSADDYAAKLRACHVMLDGKERTQVIEDGAKVCAAAAGLTLVDDPGLIAENAGLTEWPVPLLGRFDETFLSVPPEVIQLTMRTNQKYFSCAHPDGTLAPAFVCTANIAATDGGFAIVRGNERVLSARLADARFFWEADLRVPLEEQAKKLGDIVFHEKLGTVADKVDRVAKLARWLVEEGIVKSSPGRGGGPPAQPVVEGGSDQTSQSPMATDNPLHHAAHGPPPHTGEDLNLATLTERAARLCKADLVTQMVGEFPELQGIIGGYLASAQGEHPQVAAAIRDHYKPVGQGDEVPTAPITVAVSLADKLDTVIGFFAASLPPTGSKDPFALRRAALGIVGLLTANAVRLEISSALEVFYRSHAHRPPHGGKGPDAFYLADPDDALTEKDFGSQGFWMERFDGIRDGQETDEYVAHPLLFDEEGRWKSFELGFTNEKVYYEQLGADELAYFALLDFSWVQNHLLDFFADRLKVQQREAGVRQDLIDAVFALGGEDDLVRLLARVHALQAFVETGEGADLLAGYKRAANILKKEGWGHAVVPAEAGTSGREDAEARARSDEEPAPGVAEMPASAGMTKPLSYTPEPAEEALMTALASAQPLAVAATAREDFAAAMAALASLRAPVDAFFDAVTVNDPDPAKRDARLALLARFRGAVHAVADFSKIEG